MTTRLIIATALSLTPLFGTASNLEEYGTLTGKTVLAAPGLPPLPNPITPDSAVDKTNAMAAIESALARQGIALVPDGPHFVRVYPNTNLLQEALARTPLRGAEVYPAPGESTDVRHLVDWTGADMHMVLAMYAELRQRNVLRPAFMSLPPLTLKTASALTTNEVVYAMETLLAMNGIATVDDGKKFVEVVQVNRQTTVKPRAPQPDPSAQLIDPTNVPALMDVYPARSATPLNQPFDKSAKRLLNYYAELAGKTAKSSGMHIEDRPAWFHIQTSLTKAELLYAIEATLALDGLAVIDVDANTIRLGYSRELQ